MAEETKQEKESVNKPRKETVNKPGNQTVNKQGNQTLNKLTSLCLERCHGNGAEIIIVPNEFVLLFRIGGRGAARYGKFQVIIFTYITK